MPRTLAPLLLALVLASPCLADDAPRPAPTWVQPTERAREVARKAGKPLLIISLNGNLDGFC